MFVGEIQLNPAKSREMKSLNFWRILWFFFKISGLWCLFQVSRPNKRLAHVANGMDPVLKDGKCVFFFFFGWNLIWVPSLFHVFCDVILGDSIQGTICSITKTPRKEEHLDGRCGA